MEETEMFHRKIIDVVIMSEVVCCKVLRLTLMLCFIIADADKEPTKNEDNILLFFKYYSLLTEKSRSTTNCKLKGSSYNCLPTF